MRVKHVAIGLVVVLLVLALLALLAWLQTGEPLTHSTRSDQAPVANNDKPTVAHEDSHDSALQAEPIPAASPPRQEESETVEPETTPQEPTAPEETLEEEAIDDDAVPEPGSVTARVAEHSQTASYRRLFWVSLVALDPESPNTARMLFHVAPDADGVAHFPSVAPGTYTLYADPQMQEVAPFAVSAREHVELDLHRITTETPLRIQFVWSDGEPVAFTLYQWFRSNRGPGEGEFLGGRRMSMPGRSAGPTNRTDARGYIEADVQGYWPQWIQAEVHCETHGMQSVTIDNRGALEQVRRAVIPRPGHLSSGAPLLMRVVDSDSQLPVHQTLNFNLRLVRGGTQRYPTRVVTANGEFAVDWVPAGTYRIQRAITSGIIVGPFEFEVEAGIPAELALPVYRAVPLRLDFVNWEPADGEVRLELQHQPDPVAPGTVKLRHVSAPPAVSRARNLEANPIVTLGTQLRQGERYEVVARSQRGKLRFSVVVDDATTPAFPILLPRE